MEPNSTISKNTKSKPKSCCSGGGCSSSEQNQISSNSNNNEHQQQEFQKIATSSTCTSKEEGLHPKNQEDHDAIEGGVEGEDAGHSHEDDDHTTGKTGTCSAHDDMHTHHHSQGHSNNHDHSNSKNLDINDTEEIVVVKKSDAKRCCHGGKCSKKTTITTVNENTMTMTLTMMENTLNEKSQIEHGIDNNVNDSNLSKNDNLLKDCDGHEDFNTSSSSKKQHACCSIGGSCGSKAKPEGDAKPEATGTECDNDEYINNKSCSHNHNLSHEHEHEHEHRESNCVNSSTQSKSDGCCSSSSLKVKEKANDDDDNDDDETILTSSTKIETGEDLNTCTSASISTSTSKKHGCCSVGGACSKADPMEVEAKAQTQVEPTSTECNDKEDTNIKPCGHNHNRSQEHSHRESNCAKSTSSTNTKSKNGGCCSSSSSSSSSSKIEGDNCCSSNSQTEEVTTTNSCSSRKTAQSNCCSTKSLTNVEKKSSCCSSDHCHDQPKPQPQKGRHGTCSSAYDRAKEENVHPKPVFVAIIREQHVDVYDVKGEMKSFKCIDSIAKHDFKNICFSTHGHDVDLLLTPCFDEDGNFGEPDEGCFCGIDVPHLHAHLFNDKVCAVASSDKRGGDKLMKLAALTLLPEDEITAVSAPSSSPSHAQRSNSNSNTAEKKQKPKCIPISESLPYECNSQEYKKILIERGIDNSVRTRMFKVLHQDHYDILVHNTNTGNLHLEHDCNHCGDTDIHGKLDLIYQRTWNAEEDMNRLNKHKNARGILLNFYHIPKRAFGLLDGLMTDLFSTDTTDRVNIIRNQISTAASPKKSRGKAIQSQQPMKQAVPSCCFSNISCDERTSLFKSDGSLTPTEDSDDYDDGHSLSTLKVQSKIFVQHICCASEIPMINDVVQPLKGVTNVKVNTTTKTVYVDHNVEKISAEEIVSALNKENFGAKLKLDGSIALRQSQPSLSSNYVESKIFVQHICCASEIPMINDVVQPLEGVSDVKVNTTTKMVYVKHDSAKVSAHDIESALNEEQFGAKLKVDGAASLQKALGGGGSKFYSGDNQHVPPENNMRFVESTFLVVSLFDENVTMNIKQMLKQKYTKEHISHVDTHVMSRTIKVDHNPYLLKAAAIRDILLENGVDLSIHADGYEEGIWTMHGEEDELEETKPKLQWYIALSGVFWIISLLYAVGGTWDSFKYFGLISVSLATPKIAMKAYTTLRRLQFDTNCMMLFATLGAIGLSEYSEAAAVAFLFSLSEWLESMSTSRARNALSSIAKLRPERARVQQENGTNKFIIVPATSVSVGSVVSVPTGDKIPCDGVVYEGSSTVDESSLTGESRPIQKSPGDVVSGGTINTGRAQLLVKTTSLANDSAVARLIRLVEEAQVNRSPTEMLIDEVAKRYTPVVVLAAISMCTFPWMMSAEIGREWTKMGLITIVIACPCALIISTPVTYVAGIAAAAQMGIVVKGGAHFEAIARVNRIAFDKTGTLTKGDFKLLHLREWNKTFKRERVLQYLYAMEMNASHPLALALISAAKSENVSVPEKWGIQDHRSLDGEGVVARINKKKVYVGNMRLFERLGLLHRLPDKELDFAKKWMEQGCTVGFLSVEGAGIVASYCVADAVRTEAKDVVSSIRKFDIEPVMLTGDNAKAALHIGQCVGLSIENIKSQLLPHEKLDYIKGVVAESENNFEKIFPCSFQRRNDLIMMCGDGVNDAPALAMADVGVAMGAGAAIAMDSADVTLLDSDLHKLLKLVELSKRVSWTIIENVAFSLFVKLIVMTLTFAGYTNLWAAIGSDVGAMLVVTANGMKLLPSKKSIKNQSGYDAKRIEGGDIEEQVQLI